MIGAIIGLGARLLGSKVLKSTGGGLLDKAGGIVDKVLDQRGQKATADQELDAAPLKQYAAESLQVRENRTWFDSLVDGLNRLIRPVGFALTVWIFIWPIWNLNQFAQSMVAYEAIPAWLAGLIITVWSLFFGGRFITKDMMKDGFKGRSKKEISEILSKQQEIHAALTKTAPETLVIPEVKGIESEVQPQLKSHTLKNPTMDQYQGELSSEKPLSLPSIVEWNRKHNPTF